MPQERLPWKQNVLSYAGPTLFMKFGISAFILARYMVDQFPMCKKHTPALGFPGLVQSTLTIELLCVPKNCVDGTRRVLAWPLWP